MPIEYAGACRLAAAPDHRRAVSPPRRIIAAPERPRALVCGRRFLPRLPWQGTGDPAQDATP
ncbi:MAG: hypothetical protein M0Z42_07765, partial [Actinomycetota bacterium]|nr:hypothetical protein [Actinomycetota bacterium]